LERRSLLDPDLETQPDRDPYEFFSEIKGISTEQAKAMHEHAKNAGREAGIEFNFDNSKIANSYKAHLLIQLAKQKGVADAMEEALFKAQFIDAENIDDESTLLKIATSVGIAEENAKKAFNSDELSHAVAQDGLMARQLGINAVPFFVFNDKYGVSVLTKSYEEFSAGDKGLQIISSGESCDADGNCN